MDDSYIFQNPKYYTIDGDENRKGIQTVCNGIHISFLCTEGNNYYDEIMRQVKEGTLTIADAD